MTSDSSGAKFTMNSQLSGNADRESVGEEGRKEERPNTETKSESE